MTPQRWDRIKQIFERAVELDPASRASFLDSACGNDPSLRAEVEQLVAEDDRGGGLIEESLVPIQKNALSSGSRLGPYEIVSAIGAGGMGEVYQARDSRLKRTVAIKVLPEYLASDRQARLRFEREAAAVAGLSHPHICALYDIGHQDGIDYLVMEYLEGETVAHRLSNSALPLDELVRYAVEIADALEEAHQHGIIHRDLKPSNVMLTKSGAKLLDFGVAKRQRRAQTAAATSTMSLIAYPTSPGMMVGTLAYMSPEQARGEEIDARSDLFSLGAVLYEMATGIRAFPGTPTAVIDALLNHEPEPPREINVSLPERLEIIINKALQKDRQFRYQTGAELRDDLARLLQFGERELRGRGGTQALFLALAVLALLSLLLYEIIPLIVKD
jgi:serine/threonine protein kinase